MAIFVEDDADVITHLHQPFMVDNEVVLWADALSDDGILDRNGDRYKQMYFMSSFVKIAFVVNGDNMHLTNFYRTDTARPPARGFATSFLKKCIHVAAKHVGASSVSLNASGSLISDAPLEEQLMETVRSFDLDTLFAHAMQIPCYNSTSCWGDFDYIRHARRYVVARLMNQRLVTYYEKVGFRVCDPRRDDLDAQMVMAC